RGRQRRAGRLRAGTARLGGGDSQLARRDQPVPGGGARPPPFVRSGGDQLRRPAKAPAPEATVKASITAIRRRLVSVESGESAAGAGASIARYSGRGP